MSGIAPIAYPLTIGAGTVLGDVTFEVELFEEVIVNLVPLDMEVVIEDVIVELLPLDDLNVDENDFTVDMDINF